MIYFTSDLHLGHRGVIEFNNRPFESVEEMNNVLITNYNSIVRNNDTVYILGDLAYRIREEEANNLISKLRGRKILILGNHDDYTTYDESLFEEICDYKFLKWEKRRYALMHYPLLEWNRQQYGSLMLHGHIHSKGPYNYENKKNGILRYDVGVDANHYYPVSINQIIEFFELDKDIIVTPRFSKNNFL